MTSIERKGMMTAVMSAVLMMSATSCQEFLPPREEPKDYFSTSITVYYDVLYPINEAANRNRLLIQLRIVNTFDEVISDYINIAGTVVLEWQVPPGENLYGVDPKRTFTLSLANIQNAPGYDPELGIISIAPKDTVVLACAWDFTSDDRSSMIGRFTQKIDYGCLVEDAPGHTAYRRVTNKQMFKVTAAARLTKKTSTFYFTPFYFSQCFVVPYKANILQPDSGRCRSENNIDPCTLVK